MQRQKKEAQGFYDGESVMGNIREIVGKFFLSNRGWRPKENSYNLPFSVELKENFHIHWQDVRVEMDSSAFDDFTEALMMARSRWAEDGRPLTLNNVKRYGWWPGEGNKDFYKDRNEETGHNFKEFPRTEKGKLYCDNAVQLERQKGGQYHLHWKNFRMEFGKKTFKALRKIFK